MSVAGGNAIRVVIADDEALVRGGFRAILERQEDITVVSEATTGAEAVDACRGSEPDVVLMDLRMPDLDGVEATRLITRDTAARVLILTTFDLDEHVHAALKAGASGFLTKDTPPETLAEAVRAIARGDTLLSPTITRRLVETYTQLPAPGGPTPETLSGLTPRELEVLREVARGASNAQIAARMYLSEATIKTHISRLLGKLHLPDRVHAVVLAYESGLVRPGESD